MLGSPQIKAGAEVGPSDGTAFWGPRLDTEPPEPLLQPQGASERDSSEIQTMGRGGIARLKWAWVKIKIQGTADFSPCVHLGVHIFDPQPNHVRGYACMCMRVYPTSQCMSIESWEVNCSMCA